MKFTYANYEVGELAEGTMLCKLIKVQSNSLCTIYTTVGTSEQALAQGHFVVVFANQVELLKLIEENLGAIFGLGFIKKGNRKHSYNLPISEYEKILALTVARASVIVSKEYMSGRGLITRDNGIIMIV